MSRGYRQEVGKQGEDIAVDYLTGKGYYILERNFRAHGYEIDIIAKDGDNLVFIEVKTNKRGGFGDPECRVTPQKQKQIGIAALGYLQEKDYEKNDCRFDVIAIEAAGAGHNIRHIIDAFWMEPDNQEGLF